MKSKDKSNDRNRSTGRPWDEKTLKQRVIADKTIVYYGASASVHVTSRDRCRTGHDVRTHSWFDTENAAPATVQVYKHIHTRANEYLHERLHG